MLVQGDKQCPAQCITEIVFFYGDCRSVDCDKGIENLLT